MHNERNPPFPFGCRVPLACFEREQSNGEASMGCWQLGSDVRPHLVSRYGLWKSHSFPFHSTPSFHVHWRALCSPFWTQQILSGQSPAEVRKQAMKGLQNTTAALYENTDTFKTYQRNVVTFSSQICEPLGKARDHMGVKTWICGMRKGRENGKEYKRKIEYCQEKKWKEIFHRMKHKGGVKEDTLSCSDS